jgi:hypothetical protein
MLDTFQGARLDHRKACKEREVMGRCGREYVEECHDIRKLPEKLLKLHEELLA